MSEEGEKVLPHERQSKPRAGWVGPAILLALIVGLVLIGINLPPSVWATFRAIFKLLGALS